jgi:hypothetical protein
MPEWWTYRLSDFLMFEPKTYYRLFELYNYALWPGQLPALACGAVLLWLVWRTPTARGLLAGILAVAWLWVGWGFHWQRYAAINSAAPSFAAGFALQAGLLILTGMVHRGPRGESTPAGPDRVGLGVALFGMVVQPLIGPLLGRGWSSIELFGLAPDPTTTVTLGILLTGPAPRVLWIVPLSWCLITGATLWAMHASDAWMMPGVGAVVAAWAVYRKRRVR